MPDDDSQILPRESPYLTDQAHKRHASGSKIQEMFTVRFQSVYRFLEEVNDKGFGLVKWQVAMNINAVHGDPTLNHIAA